MSFRSLLSAAILLSTPAAYAGSVPGSTDDARLMAECASASAYQQPATAAPLRAAPIFTDQARAVAGRSLPTSRADYSLEAVPGTTDQARELAGAVEVAAEPASLHGRMMACSQG